MATKKSSSGPHIEFQGLKIFIENPSGSVREGTSKAGVKWRTEMKNDYGYVKRTEGVDGDHVDVFIGPNDKAEYVYVVHQVKPATGEYDEDKCMLGFDSSAAAKKAYLAHYDTPKFFGAMTTVPLSLFKEKIFNDKGEPIISDIERKLAVLEEKHLAGRHDQRKHASQEARAEEITRGLEDAYQVHIPSKIKTSYVFSPHYSIRSTRFSLARIFKDGPYSSRKREEKSNDWLAVANDGLSCLDTKAYSGERRKQFAHAARKSDLLAALLETARAPQQRDSVSARISKEFLDFVNSALDGVIDDDNARIAHRYALGIIDDHMKDVETLPVAAQHDKWAAEEAVTRLINRGDANKQTFSYYPKEVKRIARLLGVRLPVLPNTLSAYITANDSLRILKDVQTVLPGLVKHDMPALVCRTDLNELSDSMGFGSQSRLDGFYENVSNTIILAGNGGVHYTHEFGHYLDALLAGGTKVRDENMWRGTDRYAPTTYSITGNSVVQEIYPGVTKDVASAIAAVRRAPGYQFSDEGRVIDPNDEDYNPYYENSGPEVFAHAVDQYLFHRSPVYRDVYETISTTKAASGEHEIQEEYNDPESSLYSSRLAPDTQYIDFNYFEDNVAPKLNDIFVKAGLMPVEKALILKHLAGKHDQKKHATKNVKTTGDPIQYMGCTVEMLKGSDNVVKVLSIDDTTKLLSSVSQATMIYDTENNNLYMGDYSLSHGRVIADILRAGGMSDLDAERVTRNFYGEEDFTDYGYKNLYRFWVYKTNIGVAYDDEIAPNSSKQTVSALEHLRTRGVPDTAIVDVYGGSSYHGGMPLIGAVRGVDIGVLKHLPGKHDQQTHGHGEGGVERQELERNLGITPSKYTYKKEAKLAIQHGEELFAQLVPQAVSNLSKTNWSAELSVPGRNTIQGNNLFQSVTLLRQRGLNEDADKLQAAIRNEAVGLVETLGNKKGKIIADNDAIVSFFDSSPGLNDAGNWIADAISTPIPAVPVGVKAGRRSNASPEGINIAAEADEPGQHLAHEFGHMLGWSSPTINNAARSFIDSRAGPVVELRSYKDAPSEKVYSDAFIDPYIGKVYQSDANEALSVGLQFMYASPRRLLNTDPDHFFLTLSAMHNKGDIETKHLPGQHDQQRHASKQAIISDSVADYRPIGRITLPADTYREERTFDLDPELVCVKNEDIFMRSDKALLVDVNTSKVYFGHDHGTVALSAVVDLSGREGSSLDAQTAQRYVKLAELALYNGRFGRVWTSSHPYTTPDGQDMPGDCLVVEDYRDGPVYVNRIKASLRNVGFTKPIYFFEPTGYVLKHLAGRHDQKKHAGATNLLREPESMEEFAIRELFGSVELTKPVILNEKDLPPVEEGHTRIYHGTMFNRLSAIDFVGVKPGAEVGLGEQINNVLASRNPEEKFGNTVVIADVPNESLTSINDAWVELPQIEPEHIQGYTARPFPMEMKLLLELIKRYEDYTQKKHKSLTEDLS